MYFKTNLVIIAKAQDKRKMLSINAPLKIKWFRCGWLQDCKEYHEGLTFFSSLHISVKHVMGIVPTCSLALHSTCLTIPVEIEYTGASSRKTKSAWEHKK
jgi:hypothetical protein